MIRRLRLSNFRRHAETELEFTPDEQLVVVAGDNGTGKCLPGTTSVWDAAAGVQVPVADFVARRCTRTLGTVDGAVRIVPVSAWHTLATRPVVEVVLDDGHRLRAAATHPVLTDRGFRPAGFLGPGDTVVRTDASMDPGAARPSVVHAGRRRRTAPTTAATVTEVRPDGHEPMFDITVDTDEHTYLAGDGVVTHNSTLISEALLFAFFGESRHGRRRLDDLVRRGAELEGVEVHVDFEAAGHLWSVTRRRVEGIATAKLAVDGRDLTDGTSSTDAELAKVLGMDAAGFRLAVLARQKELDGLTALDRATRRRQLGRLLRIEAVGKAAGRATDEYNRAAEILAAFPPAADLDALATVLDAATTTRDEALATRDRATADLAAAEDAARDTALADERARAAQTAHAAALAAATEARRAADEAASAASAARDAAAELDDPGAPAVSPEEISAAIAAADAERRRADDVTRALEDRARLATDLAELDAARLALAGAPARVAELDAALDAARTHARTLRTALDAARDGLTAADAASAVAGAEAERTRADAAGAEDLDEGVCAACGSTLTAEHLAAHRAQLTAAARAAAAAADAAATQRTVARTALDAAQRDYDDAVERGQDLRAGADAAHRDAGELAELDRRAQVLRRRLAEPAPDPVDTDALDERLAELADALDIARDTAERHRLAAAAAAEARRLAATADAARARADQLDAAARDAAVDPALAGAQQAHRVNQEAVARARETLADARETLAHAQAALSAADTALTDARAAAGSRARREHTALVAAHTKAVLKDVHELMSQRLRPQLETAATALLARLSEGRFPAVSVTSDYDVRVSDDGAFRSLGDLSGGETDLVALAVRLALAQVVADRRGTDALGLLVLDEVFGSQDAARRQSILAALRELRQIYGQIFLISHVGGLEDAADRVVDLTLDEQRVSHADER